MTDEKPTTARSKQPMPMSRGREEVHPELRISYNESDHHIPDEITKRFKAEGFSLRWIRYRIGEKEDYANIARKGKHGWVFVDSSEVPELGVSTQLTNFGRYAGLVTIEDVALAKCRTKYVKELQKLKQDRARQQLTAEEDKIRGARLDNNSKSRVEVGKKRPAFEDDTESET